MEVKSVAQCIYATAQFFIKYKKSLSYKPNYRILEIYKNDKDEYIAQIQVINRNHVFTVRIEEILAKDDLVDQFSPRDIRTLTYLGYLSINSPQYKILAKRLSEGDGKLIFSIKQKGNRNIINKTADEMVKEKEIAESLSSRDAQALGYVLASESRIEEDKLKKTLLDKAREALPNEKLC